MASRVLNFTKAATAARPAAAGIFRQGLVQRSMATTPILRHKESTPHDQDHDPAKHKEDLMKKHKDGKGHWKPELSSDSEEAVKADRGSEESVKELQDRTKKTAEETHKKGTSMRDGL